MSTRVLHTLLWLTVAAFYLGVIVVAVARDTTAHQPRAERGTQQWKIQIGYLGTVHVIDTTGVCLYVYTAAEKGGIAAVPKTQLPSGTGCE